MQAFPIEKRTSLKYGLHVLICLIITFGFKYLPPLGSITPLGMNILSIFLGVLYGWIFIEIIWPSLMGIVCLLLMSGMKPVEVLHLSFGDPIVQMSLFIFLFCAAIEYYGLAKFISTWFISRKFVYGKPWLFTYMLLGSIFLLGGLTSASPAIIIGWAILYGICETCGYQKGDGYPTMMVFGIVFAGQMGMALIPFKQAPLVILGVYANMAGNSGIAYGKYMLLAILICLLASVAFVLLGKYLFRPDMTRLLNLNIEKLNSAASFTLNKNQKIVLGFLVLLIFLLIAPTILPKDFFLCEFLATIGNAGIVMLIIAIMAAIKIDGEPLFNFKIMADKGIIWPVVLLLAFVQPVSWLMAQKSTGIAQFLANVMQPLFSLATPFTFAIIAGFATLALSQLMNNAAIGIAMVPIVYNYCQATGSSPDLALIMVIMSMHLAFLTPAASPPAALLHGNDWSNERAIWRTAPLVMLLAWLTVLLVVMLAGKLLF